MMTGHQPPPHVTVRQKALLWTVAVLCLIIGFGFTAIGLIAIAQGTRGTITYVMLAVFVLVGLSGVSLTRDLVRGRRAEAEMLAGLEELERARQGDAGARDDIAEP